ncbi:MAG: HD domain-containing protein [Lachnospiraceae bacterium]|nr:HD domain-containing protein [Lachnospiraceae bacterium]
MELIHSKDIYYVIRDVLKLLDPKIMNHGERTAYILYKMLSLESNLEMYQIAELALIATLHDIGAYKTDYQKDRLAYESKDCIPHSIYGYLFLLYLTPFKDRAKIVLYHHTDYNRLPRMDYEYLDIIHYLNVAEKMDIYSSIMGSKFDHMMFNKQAGSKYSPKALELLYQAEKRYGIFAKLSSGEYEKELSELYDYLIFTDDEKRDCLMGLISCVSFRSEYTMADMVTCTHICESIGEKLLLSDKQQEMLNYAAMLHDAGMCAIPRDIIEAPRSLTEEEMDFLRTHIDVINRILKGKLDQDCLDIIMTHHERGDGSGYPRELTQGKMNLLEQILQVADTVTGLTNPRSYREPKSKEEVIDILTTDAEMCKYSKEVVKIFVKFYDKIMDGVKLKSEEKLSTYRRMVENYEVTYRQIVK